MVAVTSRRSASWSLRAEASDSKPQASSIRSTLSSRMGDNGSGFCQRSRPDQCSSPGGCSRKKAARRRSKRRGGGAQKAQKPSASKEAQKRGGEVESGKAAIKADARSLHSPEHTADILCSGEGQRALCKDVYEISDHGGVYEADSHDALHDPGALPSWQSLQKISFEKWASTLCGEVLKTGTAFASFLRSTLSVRRSIEVGSEKALFPLPVPKEGVFMKSPREGSRQRRNELLINRFM